MSPTTVATAGGRIGVLLVNLGTPDATDYWSMRRYLKEFLSDRRVIEVNRIKWWLVLNLIILTVRPGRKGRTVRMMRLSTSHHLMRFTSITRRSERNSFR